MATAFQFGAFQLDSFQIEETPHVFTQCPYWPMVTVRQRVAPIRGSGLTYGFPIILGGTEVLRELRATAEMAGVMAPVVAPTRGAGFALAFPVILGGTETLRTLRNATDTVRVKPRVARMTPTRPPAIHECGP